jgi:agmatine deiminase
MPKTPEKSRTPAELGFRMPAEWEPHAATWLAWPYNLETWEGHLDGAQQAFVEIIETLAPYEKIHLLVPDQAVKNRAEEKLRKGKLDWKNLEIHLIESGDVWFRDYGPIFVAKGKETNREIAYTKWKYNAYGHKYDDLLIGNHVPDLMPLEKFRRFETGLVLEGGSIDVNGSGTLLTTESCLLSPDRNPELNKGQIEKALKDYLGVTNVLWLHAGIEGDDTTGHIDDLTRFVGPSTVVTVEEKDPADPNYAPLMENARRLEHMKNEHGKTLTVIPLPMPKPLHVDGRRMAASYANFYIANGIVLVPVYKQPSDDEALSILKNCFPDRKVMGIDCRKLIWGYGSIHCATQQQPK